MCNVVDGEDIGGNTISELLDIDKYAQFLRPMDGAINRAVQRLVDENVLPLKTFDIGRCYTIEIDGVAQTNNANKTLREYITDLGQLINLFLRTQDIIEPVFADEDTLLGELKDISDYESYIVEYLPQGVNEQKNTTDYDLNVLVNGVASFVAVYLLRNGEIISRNIKCDCVGNTVELPRLRDDYCYRFVYRYSPDDVSPFMKKPDDIKDYNKITLDIPDNLARLLPYAVFGDVYLHYDANIAATLGTQIFESRLSQIPTVYDDTQRELVNIFRGFY